MLGRGESVIVRKISVRDRETDMPGPLAGIRVIDVTEGAQGPWAGALLADLGADVIKVEKSEGEMMRKGAPRKRGQALPNMGMNHGKRNISLDLKDPADQAILHDLIRTADVFMENWRRGVAKRLSVDFETLSAINPRLVYASASGFGETGRYAHKPTVDNISQAMAGYYSLNGPKHGPWERPRFIAIDFTSPLTFVQAIQLGLISRDKSGLGQHVRCSQLETLMAVGQVRAAEYFASDEVPQPMGSESAWAVPSQAFKTADSWIMVDVTNEAQWRALCAALRLDVLAEDPEYATNAARVEHRDALIERLQAAFIRYTAHRWDEILSAAGVPSSMITVDIEDLYTDTQVVANGLVVTREHPSVGWVRTNAVPWDFSDTPAVYGPLASPLDGDRASVLAELEGPQRSDSADIPGSISKSAPLTGLRVLDLTQGDGAPFAAMQLGDAGADVIKVEPVGGDWARPLGSAKISDEGDGPLFMSMNRNKRSIAIDLESDEGRALVRELARDVDVVLHSFPKAGDAQRLGLDYAALWPDNQALIYCDISTIERVGPDADKPATDLTVQARSGLPRFLGVRGEAPLRFGSNYAGVTSAMYAVQAILAALYVRKRTGRGQSISTSYLRAMIATQQNYLTSFSDPDDTTALTGFHTMHLDKPAGGTPTADGLIDFNLSYSGNPPTVMRALMERLGTWDDFAKAHPEMEHPTTSYADQAVARPFIEAGMQRHTRDEVLRILDNELSVMCAPVHDYRSMFADPGVLEQETLVTVNHPTRGATKLVGLPWKLTDTPGAITLAPPTLGEHTNDVLAGMGLDVARIRELRTQGVVA